MNETVESLRAENTVLIEALRYAHAFINVVLLTNVTENIKLERGINRLDSVIKSYEEKRK